MYIKHSFPALNTINDIAALKIHKACGLGQCIHLPGTNAGTKILLSQFKRFTWLLIILSIFKGGLCCSVPHDSLCGWNFAPLASGKPFCLFSLAEDQLPSGFPTIDMGPQLKVVEKARIATMLCAASGNPDPEISWFKDFLPVDTATSNGRIKQLRSGTTAKNVSFS